MKSRGEQKHTKQPRGFTIVELLIVIVVIGILAAIVIVAYNGIQRKASNTARIAYAKQAMSLIKSAYLIKNSTLPITDDRRCLIANYMPGCTDWLGNAGTSGANSGNIDDNAALISYMASAGRVPTANTGWTSKSGGTERRGIGLDHNSGRTYNGKPAPVIIWYLLDGEATKCGVPDVETQNTASSVNETNITSTTGYSYTGGSVFAGLTMCSVAIPEITS